MVATMADRGMTTAALCGLSGHKGHSANSFTQGCSLSTAILRALARPVMRILSISESLNGEVGLNSGSHLLGNHSQ